MKVHFMGIKGSGIEGVSKLAAQMGFNVDGCDISLNGHDEDHVEDADLVVISPAVLYQNEDHPEFIKAKEENKLITWQEFVAKYLMDGKKIIAVAGTHGKSTTTAMVIKLLEDCGFDPLAILGAKLIPSNENFRFGKGEHFVIEADEFNDNFLSYHPSIAILNNVEFDHPDYFENETVFFESFQKFLKNLTNEKVLITNSSNKGIEKVLATVEDDIKVIDTKDNQVDFKLKIFGEHIRNNASQVYALGKYLEINEEKIKNSLENFLGIKRRMELVFNNKGIKVFDDYAHHPTAIKATLEGLRKEFPDSRIIGIVEPHGYKRTKSLLSLYENSMESADLAIIGPIFKARDQVDTTVSSVSVSDSLRHNNAHGFNNSDEIKKYIAVEAKEGDIILVMGAGQSNLWAQNLFKN